MPPIVHVQQSWRPWGCRPSSPRLHGGARNYLGRRHAISGVPNAAVAGPPPPYTLLSTPVYSLVTRGAGSPPAAAAGSGGDAAPGGSGSGLHGPPITTTTMNIVTYATPIAIAPSRKMVLGLYVGSLSWQNVRETGQGVLQILQEQHAPLLEVLGRRSGRDVDKLQAVRRAGHSLVDAFGLPVLQDALGVMHLRLASDFTSCGDHDVALFDVVGHKVLQPPPHAPLYTQFLRDGGYL